MRFYLMLLTTLLGFSSHANITKDKVKNGNWLTTVSIGLNVEAEPTMKLANTLEDLFVSRQGGYYKHAFDINDKNLDPHSDPVIKFSKIKIEFEKLNDELTRFKRSQPDKARTVVFGLTGHGITDLKGRYSFQISRYEKISGEQLMDLVESINAERVILIMQSCQSGTVANSLFANFVQEVRSSLENSKLNNKKGVAVITPVARYINSPIYSFEQVLEKSFRKASDVNRNEIVNFEEWTNSLLENSIRHKDYLPFKDVTSDSFIKELKSKSPEIAKEDDQTVRRYVLRGFNGAGIAPQIYSRNIPAISPIFVTPEGASKVARGIELDPARDTGRAERSAKVKRMHDQVVEVLRDAIRIQVEGKSYEDVEARLLELGNNQPPWIQRQLANRFDFVFNFKNPFSKKFVKDASHGRVLTNKLLNQAKACNWIF